MKTTLTLFISFLFAASFAQIPNNGFENWTTVGSYKNPDGWATLNDLTGPLGAVTCTQGTPGNPGSYYLKLTAKTVPVMGVSQGLAFTGYFDASQNPHIGFAYNARPSFLTGKWQYMAYGNDQGMIAAALTKWNPSTMESDTVAILTYPLPGMVMSWANFSLPFTYLSSAVPDTAIIYVVTSGAVPVANSYVYLDNLNFAFAVGIGESSASDNFILSPNPASDKLTLTYLAEGTDWVNISIFDMNGKLVADFHPGYSTRGENREVLDISDLATGSYFIQLTLGNKTTTNKLLIK